MINFNSLIELLDYFKDEKTCVEYYANIRWNGNPTCPHCNHDKPYVISTGYKCSNNKCYKKFSVKYGTIFQNSSIPMRIWLAAIYLLTNHKKGISSVQLAKDLKVTQKSAWFMLHRIRKMLVENEPELLGENNPVEADEAFIGGKERNKHYSKRRNKENPNINNDGTPYRNKQVVFGVIERNGKVSLQHIPSAKRKYVNNIINEKVSKTTNLYTDESKIYNRMKKRYNHHTIKHAEGIYVSSDVYTNTIESFWSTLKRGLHGIYHHMSAKHLSRYLEEFAARYNTRDITCHERIEYFLANANRPLTYQELITELK